jgi:CIC family chloride channel protein
MVMASVAVSLLFAGFVKAVATCLTLGSGGSGGMFAPSLLLGALTGGAFGLGLHAAGFAGAPDPSQCALVGMAAMIAATAHAPLTGVLLVYELTHIPSVILPLMLTAVIATTMSRLLHRESIYTASLSVLGIRLGSLSDLTVLRRVRVADLDLDHPEPVQPHEPASRLVEMLQQRNIDEFVVQEADGRYRGMVTSRDLRETLLNREIIPLLTVEELTRDDLPRLQPSDTLDMAMDRFSRHDVECLPVLDGARLLGLLSRRAMLKRYQLELEQAG